MFRHAYAHVHMLHLYIPYEYVQRCDVALVCWLLNVPATHYSVSQGRTCFNGCACCHTETKTEVTDQTCYRGRNSSVGSAWARCPQRRGFDPPLGTFSGRGDFPLGVNMGSNSISPKTLSDESINRGLVCAHMRFIARTQKILTFMS